MNVFRQARLDRIVELLFYGASFEEIARDIRLTSRQLRRIRKTAAFRETYEKLRVAYDVPNCDWLPRRLLEMEKRREEGVTAFYEVLGSGWAGDRHVR